MRQVLPCGPVILTAEAVAQRFAEILVLQRGILAIQIDLQVTHAAVVIGLSLILVLADCGSGDIHIIQLAGLVHAERRVGVGEDGNLHLIQLHLVFVPEVFIFGKDQLVVLLPLCQLKGAVVNVFVRGCCEILAVLLHQVLPAGHEGGAREHGEKIRRGGGQNAYHSLVVGSGDAQVLDGYLPRGHFLAVFQDFTQIGHRVRSSGIHHPLQAVDAVFGGNGLAVTPLGVAPEVEGIGEAVVGNVVALRHAGLHLAVVVAHQAVEQMVGHSGGVHGVGLFRIHGGRVAVEGKPKDLFTPGSPALRGRLRPASAAGGGASGQRTENHCQRKRHTQDFPSFHCYAS